MAKKKEKATIVVKNYIAVKEFLSYWDNIINSFGVFCYSDILEWMDFNDDVLEFSSNISPETIWKDKEYITYNKKFERKFIIFKTTLYEINIVRDRST